MKKSNKQISDNLDRRVEKIYYKHCSGLQLSIMKFRDVLRHGREAMLAGDPEEVVGEKLKTFVQSL